MAQGSWMNNDGLYLQYGTTKAIPTTGGDYCMPGELREIEISADLTKLTTTPLILEDTTFVGANVFVEQVEVVADEAAVGGTSVSVGLIGYDRSTVASNTGFVSALPIANINVAGEKNILTAGISGAGAYVGTVTPSAGYVTALAAGTFTDGTIRIRIKYRGVTPITQ